MGENRKMLALTVFAICTAISLTICWFTVDARSAREKVIVFLWVMIPSLVASYGVEKPCEMVAAVRGFVGPWIGVAVWQLYQRHMVNRNYQQILTPGAIEEVDNDTTITAGGGLDVATPGRD